MTRDDDVAVYHAPFSSGYIKGKAYASSRSKHATITKACRPKDLLLLWHPFSLRLLLNQMATHYIVITTKSRRSLYSPFKNFNHEKCITQGTAKHNVFLVVTVLC